MTATSDNFDSDGVSRYGNALNTIKVFERRVCQIIKNLLETESPKLGLRLDPSAGAIFAKPGDQGSQSWIRGLATGYLEPIKEPITVELGIWWNPPAPDAGVIFYANFDQPKTIRSVPLRSSTGNAKYLADTHNRIYTLPQAQPDIYKELNGLLKQLLSVKLPKNM